MDIPVGKLVGESMDVDNVDFKQLLSKLESLKFSGYMALDLVTNNGMEEGVLLFNSGAIVAAEYVYFSGDHVIAGGEALPLVLNACASNGRFDLHELQKRDVELAEGFNKNLLVRKSLTTQEAISMIPETFVAKLLETEKKEIKPAMAKVEGVDKGAILKKYGIVHPDEKKVDDLLRQVMEA
jgi:hypothetical protein